MSTADKNNFFCDNKKISYSQFVQNFVLFYRPAFESSHNARDVIQAFLGQTIPIVHQRP